MKKNVIVAVHVKDIEEISDLPAFIHSWQYGEEPHPNEWGKIETSSAIIRFLAIQPERLNPLDDRNIVCDSLTSTET